MKHSINLITAVLLMLLLSCCVCAATAEWMPGAASPTDLAPVDQKLMLGDTWSDTLEEEQELTGRLRMFYSGTIHLLASGADLTVTAQKEPVYSSSETVWDTDTNTGRLEKAWFAEEGTYLLTVRTKNGKTGAFTLKFLSDKAYQKLMEEEEEARWKLIPLADEELERQGFFQAVVIREEGAALYRSMDGNTVPMQYLPADVLMNLLPMNDEWGKVQLVRSADGGRTWTKPETVVNDPLDDRDGGIMELSNGDLVLTYFTSVAFSSNDEYGRHFGKIEHRDFEEYFGNFTRRSTDGGKTWENPVRTVGSAPHGGIQLSDRQAGLLEPLLKDHDLVAFMDNQYADKTSMEKTVRLLKEDPWRKVFIWPPQLAAYKDVNESVVACPRAQELWSSDKFLRSRVFHGAAGLLELARGQGQV